MTYHFALRREHSLVEDHRVRAHVSETFHLSASVLDLPLSWAVTVSADEFVGELSD